MPVDDIVAEEQGNAEAALADGRGLQFPDGRGGEGVKDTPDQPLPDLLLHRRIALGAGDIESRRQQVELPDLLPKGHPPHQAVDEGVPFTVRGRPVRGAGGECQEEQAGQTGDDRWGFHGARG